MLKATCIYKDFGDNQNGEKVNVINNISLEIRRGEFVVITGKSGSGKTTLLYMLSGLDKPSNGKVFFNDTDITLCNDKEISKIRKKNFGFVFQFYNLIPSLTIRDNIFLPIEISRHALENEKDMVNRFTKELEINDKMNMYPHQLSGGQQQRVAIARALAINPDIIFADEPTGNLDTNSGNMVLEIFGELNKKYNKTIIMVTHDNSIANRMALREIVISDGKIINDNMKGNDTNKN